MADEQDRKGESNWNQNTDQTDPADRTEPKDQAYPLEEVMKAQSVLRAAAKMAPERYALPFIIGMLSDEIQVLREKGRTDDEIAAIITGNSLIHVDADCLREFYATPEQRSRQGAAGPIVH